MATSERPDASVVQATFAAVLVDEWVRAGVRDAVVCPGSRSTPLALALASRPELRLHVRLDERGAGFFALGLALGTGVPVVVCVTSGTAAAELHPSVVEAHHARVPLVVCTADRPPELHGVGARQTIEQGALYTGALRWSASPGVPEEAAASSWRSLGARAVLEAASGPLGPGPVHLNLAFREPLVGAAGALPPGRAGGAPWHRSTSVEPPVRLGPWPGARGVVVAGAGAGPAAAVLRLAEHLGWPLLADPLSSCRAAHPHVVAAADAIARAAPEALRPDVVLRLGSPWASRALPAFVAGATALCVDPWWRWEDPGRDAAVVYRADPVAFVEAACAAPPPATPGGWLEGWQRAEKAAQGALDEALGDGGLSEPGVARALLGRLPAASTVVVSASMPVRDLEWFAPALPDPPRVVANRGANGIDGVVATSLGLAACAGPVVALLGDLAFLHDVGSLVAAGDDAPSCTLVVVDNRGGGIFEFLPQASAVERSTFETVFATPQALDVLDAARALGVRAFDAGTSAELGAALRATVGEPGVAVVRARVPARPGNVAVHERAHAAVRRALGVAG